MESEEEQSEEEKIEDDESEEEDKAEVSRRKFYIKHSWRKEFNPFYNPKSFGKSLSRIQTDALITRIIQEVKFGITTARSGYNMSTKWKPQSPELWLILEDHLDILEGYSCQRHSDEYIYIYI